MQSIKALFRNIVHPAGIAAVAFSLLIPLLIAWAGNSQLSSPEMKKLIGSLDLHLAWWVFLIQTVLFLILFLDRGRDFIRHIQSLSIPRNWWYALLGILILATAVTGTWIEARHRVQSDESIMLTTAQNLWFEHVSGACDEGEFHDGILDCTKNATNFKARGLSFLVALGIPLFGNDLQWIFIAQLLLYFLTGLVFFLAIQAWTQSLLLSLIATTALLFQPTVMFQFRSFSVEPLYVFLSAFSLLLMHFAWKQDTPRHWALLGLVLAFFAQTRQETAFCLGAFVFLSLPRVLDRKDLRFPAFITSLTFFSIPILLTISYYQGYNFQGGQFAAHGHFFEHILINWKVMSGTSLEASGLLKNPFLTSSTWFAALGLIVLLIRNWKEPRVRGWVLFLALYHIQSYMILENVSGDFTIEINQRYALVLFPTIAFLTALLFDFAARFLWQRKDLFHEKPLTQHFAIALGVSVLLIALTMRHAESFKQNIMYNRNHLTSEETLILEWLRSEPEKPRLFVYSRPWHFIGYGYSARHYDAVRKMGSGPLQDLLHHYAGEVYYVRGLDCWDRQTWHKKAVEHRISTICDDFEHKIQTQPVADRIVTNNYHLTISKIVGTKDYDSERILKIKQFEYADSTQTTFLSYHLDQAPGQQWDVVITLNDSVVKKTPFQSGDIQDTLHSSAIHRGINMVKIAILDSQKRLISQQQATLFVSEQNAFVPLTQVKPNHVYQSWGDLQANRSVNGNPLHIAGVEYKHGLGTHAASRIEYKIEGKYQRFTALVGQDDEELGGDGMQFRVFGDGKLLWQSQTITANKMEQFNLNIQGIQTLILEVDSLGGKNYDHADWVHPTLFP